MRPLRGLTVRFGIRPPGAVTLPPAAPKPLDGMDAPVYDYEPLRFVYRAWPLPVDRQPPDPLVFGPPGSGELQRPWLACGQDGKRRGQRLPALTAHAVRRSAGGGTRPRTA